MPALSQQPVRQVKADEVGGTGDEYTPLGGCHLAHRHSRNLVKFIAAIPMVPDRSNDKYFCCILTLSSFSIGIQDHCRAMSDADRLAGLTPIWSLVQIRSILSRI